jgi:S1-C subfamily serine protease
MKRCCCLLLVTLMTSISAQVRAAGSSDEALRQHEHSSVSLELEFFRKNPNAFHRMLSLLGTEPNAYATGLVVGNGLVITAYHVVSGNLDPVKKMALGFARNDLLDVRIYTNGCEAKILDVDSQADLALLKVCGSFHKSSLSFQTTVSKDEKLFLIARPNGQKIVRYGTFLGSYTFNGIEYWSARIGARDGFSGSPVYNEQGELIGVFSGYDWSQSLAVVSPVARAQKMLEEFATGTKP